MQPSTPIADWLESIENGFGGRFGDIFVKEVRAVFDYPSFFLLMLCTGLTRTGVRRDTQSVVRQKMFRKKS